MRKSEYQVRRVERFIVTHYESDEWSGRSQGFGGEIPNAGEANRLALMLCAADPGSVVIPLLDHGIGPSTLSSAMVAEELAEMRRAEQRRVEEMDRTVGVAQQTGPGRPLG